MNTEISDIFASAGEQGLTPSEYLALNYNSANLDRLQDAVQEDFALGMPVIDGFRSTYDRATKAIDLCDASAIELDRMQAEVQSQIDAKKEELQNLTALHYSSNQDAELAWA